MEIENKQQHSRERSADKGAGKKGLALRQPIGSINGISVGENNAIKSLTTGRVDLHSIGASIQHVSASDSRLTSVGARSLAQGKSALVSQRQDRGHELWHLAQQSMGHVKPTASVNGQAVNDNPGLEREADVKGTIINRGRSET